MSRLSVFSILLTLGIIFLSSDNVLGDFGSIVDQIPKAFFPRIRRILEDIEYFKACMVKDKACTKEEADEFHNDYIKSGLKPFSSNDTALGVKLKKFSNKIGSLMKCTNEEKIDL